MLENDIVFAVRRLPDGTLYVDWCAELAASVDPNGKDTDRVIDLAEELLTDANEEADESQ